MSVWQRWLHHPESLQVRRRLFHIHLLIGTGAGAYVVLMSITGSMIVFRNQLYRRFPIEWVVNLHENLLLGHAGRFVNGIGAICVTLLSLTGAAIWWPGIAHWRRAVAVEWNAHYGRFNWELHSALGFWCFLFVLMWGISGLYFAFPQAFNSLFGVVDPSDRFTDVTLFWLSNLHFGRFNRFSESVWVVLGLVPAALAVSGVFLCCRRMVHGSPQHRGRSPGESDPWNTEGTLQTGRET